MTYRSDSNSITKPFNNLGNPLKLEIRDVMTQFDDYINDKLQIFHSMTYRNASLRAHRNELKTLNWWTFITE